MKQGDVVTWEIRAWNGNVTERAGTVVAVVPPETHPNNVGMGEVLSWNNAVRNDVTYLVKTPISAVIFWVQCPRPITEDKRYLLMEQKPVTAKAKGGVDKRDRVKIKRFLKEVGVEFSESPECINILPWAKRMWFGVTSGVEHLLHIEQIKLQ